MLILWYVMSKFRTASRKQSHSQTFIIDLKLPSHHRTMWQPLFIAEPIFYHLCMRCSLFSVRLIWWSESRTVFSCWRVLCLLFSSSRLSLLQYQAVKKNCRFISSDNNFDLYNNRKMVKGSYYSRITVAKNKQLHFGGDRAQTVITLNGRSTWQFCYQTTCPITYGALIYI